MDIQSYFKLMGKLHPSGGDLSITLHLQNIRMSLDDEDDFLTTTVLDIIEDTDGIIKGVAVLNSKEILESQGWQHQPGTYHHHYKGVQREFNGWWVLTEHAQEKARRTLRNKEYPSQ